MAARLHALTVLAADPERLASFWGELLGWERSGLDLLPDGDAPMRLSFAYADLPHDLLNQMHFHLTSYTASHRPTSSAPWRSGPRTSTSGSSPRSGTSCSPTRRATSSGCGRRDAARAADVALGTPDSGPQPPHVRCQG